VGRKARAVCPYDESGWPLRRLCKTQRSAQSRLTDLPDRYASLQKALRHLGVERGNIHQFAYPNPLLASDRTPCHSAYGKAEERFDSGFNGLMGVIDRRGRGFRFSSWSFKLHYWGEKDWADSPLIRGSKVECDDKADYTDSEVCQALWVHSSLNKAVAENANLDGHKQPKHWNVVSSHTDTIDGHGICLTDDDRFKLDLPLVENGSWVDGWTPQSLDPYAQDLPRWFRVTNDSAVTQYGDKDHFHHGTIHPTFHAHIAYAQAAVDEALKD
jgi:hypothetical protein